MAIAPITGRLRKGLIMDLTIALGGGTVCGAAWWWGTSHPLQFTPVPILHHVLAHTSHRTYI
ncbi:hypothetical protein TWF694_003711 [Orbilia ellipsospora]|uniref:Uncharacterized protein n=1 Tax=Orbilia ellipsospora TaxID=2528407 RepID=A0AAV9WZ20_9PEZI